MRPELAADYPCPGRAQRFHDADSARRGLKLIASLQQEAKPLKGVLREHLANLKPGTPIVVMIGPEGDFTPAEIG